MFYSRSTGGFYDEEIHGSRIISIVDPDWQPPEGDELAEAPTVEFANPCCGIPVDAIEITIAEHAALLEAQAAGKFIQADSDGRPVALDPPVPTAKQIALSQILTLESTATERRVREAILGLDNGWLKNVNDQIAALRAQIA